MATMWCPQCGGEYREGFTECADCGVALVAELPSAPKPPDAPAKVDHPFGPDDVSVELVRLNAVEAELVAAQLRSAGIPVSVLAVGTAGELVAIQHSEGSRVMVRRGDLAVAQAAIAELSDDRDAANQIDDAGLAAAAEAAADWSDPESGAVV